MVASVRMLGYGGSRQPLIMADFKEAKKNLPREWGLPSEARAPPPPARLAHRHLGEGPGWNQSSGQRAGQ